MFIIYFHIRFHMLNSNGSLVNHYHPRC
jgi:hypothetical protein